MNVKHLIIGSVIHFVLTIVFMFLSIGASLGLGFKENWTLVDQLYFHFSTLGLKVLRGILSLFGDQLLVSPWWVQLIAVALNSIFCVYLLIVLHQKFRDKNAI